MGGGAGVGGPLGGLGGGWELKAGLAKGGIRRGKGTLGGGEKQNKKAFGACVNHGSCPRGRAGGVEGKKDDQFSEKKKKARKGTRRECRSGYRLSWGASRFHGRGAKRQKKDKVCWGWKPTVPI